jgi:hypothetical protein
MSIIQYPILRYNLSINLREDKYFIQIMITKNVNFNITLDNYPKDLNIYLVLYWTWVMLSLHWTAHADSDQW